MSPVPTLNQKIVEAHETSTGPEVDIDLKEITQEENKEVVTKTNKDDIIKSELSPKSYDEVKSTEQMWKEGKYPEMKEFILAISEESPTAQYKVYLNQIKRLYKAVFVSDLSVRPLMLTGERYHVYHGGRRVSDTITKEQFDELLLLKRWPVSYYFVDLADPVEGRKSYSNATGIPPTAKEILDERAELVAIEDERKAAEKERRATYGAKAILEAKSLAERFERKEAAKAVAQEEELLLPELEDEVTPLEVAATDPTAPEYPPKKTRKRRSKKEIAAAELLEIKELSVAVNTTVTEEEEPYQAVVDPNRNTQVTPPLEVIEGESVFHRAQRNFQYENVNKDWVNGLGEKVDAPVKP